MDTKIEELRFVADLAHNGGMMKAQNNALIAELAKLQTELNEQKVALMEKNAALSAKDEVIAQKERRIAELEATVQQMVVKHPTMVVNQIFVLSVPKTMRYIRALDNNGRCFAGHFLHHTLSDETPQVVLSKVDEMTQLAGDVRKDLADAIKESTQKPTTQINAANYNATVSDQHNHFPQLSPMTTTPELLEDE
jgi:hypothetical protein